MSDIEATLAERGSTYGDFREQGRITQNLKRAMYDSPNWWSLPSYMREGLDMVQHKVSRILNGDPYYDDNVHDIIGYVKLMQDRMKQDRDNGWKFAVIGDPVYPTYDHEDRAITLPAVPSHQLPLINEEAPPSYEGLLDAALGLLAALGFRGGEDGNIYNDDGDTPIQVAKRHAEQETLPETAAKAEPEGEDDEEARVVVSDGSNAANPAFMVDPIRSYFETKNDQAAAPEIWKLYQGKVAWAYTEYPEIVDLIDPLTGSERINVLKQGVFDGKITLHNMRQDETVVVPEKRFALGAFEIPKK